MDCPIKMVNFHSYVSLPEGSLTEVGLRRGQRTSPRSTRASASVLGVAWQFSLNSPNRRGHGEAGVGWFPMDMWERSAQKWLVSSGLLYFDTTASPQQNEEHLQFPSVSHDFLGYVLGMMACDVTYFTFERRCAHLGHPWTQAMIHGVSLPHKQDK